MHINTRMQTHAADSYFLVTYIHTYPNEEVFLRWSAEVYGNTARLQWIGHGEAVQGITNSLPPVEKEQH